MYHDQALVPIKTIAFDEAVNVTLGLPFVRTSPDHGTAFDIAGRGHRAARQPHSRDPARRAAGRRRRAGARPVSAIDDLPPLREVVRDFDLAPKKQLGQNFLFDLNLTSRIARASGRLEGARVLEVGPGPGGLTRALLAGGAAHVVAIERDARCLPALAQIAARYPGRLTVVEADAAAFDPRPLLEAGPGEGKPRIVANLPYNVGTQLLTGWIATRAWPPFWESLTLMFQREVAERIVATPAESARTTAGWVRALRLAHAGRHPVRRSRASRLRAKPPKVTSSVRAPRPPPPSPRPATCARSRPSQPPPSGRGARCCARASSRSASTPAALCEAAGVAPTARAEEVPVDGFVAMARGIRGGRRGDVTPATSSRPCSQPRERSMVRGSSRTPCAQRSDAAACDSGAVALARFSHETFLARPPPPRCIATTLLAGAAPGCAARGQRPRRRRGSARADARGQTSSPATIAGLGPRPRPRRRPSLRQALMADPEQIRSCGSAASSPFSFADGRGWTTPSESRTA